MESELERKLVTISKRAVIARINRKLARGLRQLRKTRSERWYRDLGEYHIVDLDRNQVVDTNVDVEETAREMGVLAAWERMENEGHG